MTYNFQFRDVFAAWEFLIDGLILTLELSLVTMVCPVFGRPPMIRELSVTDALYLIAVEGPRSGMFRASL